jgi:hypothetical protein
MTRTIQDGPCSDAIARFLGEVSLAPRQVHKSLALWPLLRGSTPPEAPEYVPLSEALERGDLVIDELKQGARVPHVHAVNHGRVAVLVLFGEEIRGAKQNRIANASFLVPPHAEVVLDVSCVEQGRWSQRKGATFASGGLVVSSAIRRKMASRVTTTARAGFGFHGAQRELWSDIADRVAYSQARSHSGAYADYVATRGTDLAELGAAFRPIPGQVGFVACLGDEVVGLEAIGRPEVFSRAFRMLLHGYLIDAIDQNLIRREDRPGKRRSRFEAPEEFLAALAGATAESRASLGLGVDLRIEDARVSACALVAGDVVHVTAFPAAQ